MLANFFSAMSNSSQSFQSHVITPNQKHVLKITEILFKEGLIQSYQILDNKIHIFLKYYNDQPLFKKIALISSSKRRQFIKVNEVKKLPFHQIFIISTSKGFLTNHEAKEICLGGELICVIHL